MAPKLRPSLPETIPTPDESIPPFIRGQWRYTDACPNCKVNRKTPGMRFCQTCIDDSDQHIFDKIDKINTLKNYIEREELQVESTHQSYKKIIDENEVRIDTVREKYNKERLHLQGLKDALNKQEQSISLHVDVLSNDIRLYDSTNTSATLETHCTIVRPPKIHKDVYFGHVTLIITTIDSELRWHYGIKLENNLPDDLNNVFWSTPAGLKDPNKVFIQSYGNFGFIHRTTISNIMLNHFKDCYRVFDNKQWIKQIWSLAEIGNTKEEEDSSKLLDHLKKLEDDRNQTTLTVLQREKKRIQHAKEIEDKQKQEDEEARIIRLQRIIESDKKREEEKEAKKEELLKQQRIDDALQNEKYLQQKKEDDKKKRKQDKEAKKEDEKNALDFFQAEANEERKKQKEKEAKEQQDETERQAKERVKEKDKVLFNFKIMKENMIIETRSMIDEDKRIFDLPQTEKLTHKAREALILRHEEYNKTCAKNIAYLRRVPDQVIPPLLIDKMCTKLYDIQEFGNTDERQAILKLEDQLYKNGKNKNENESDDKLIDIFVNKICNSCSIDVAVTVVKNSRAVNPSGHLSIENFLRLLRNNFNNEDIIRQNIAQINSHTPLINSGEEGLKAFLQQKAPKESIIRIRDSLIKLYEKYVPNINEIVKTFKTFELSEELTKEIKKFLESEVMEWEGRLRRLKALTI